MITMKNKDSFSIVVIIIQKRHLLQIKEIAIVCKMAPIATITKNTTCKDKTSDHS